MEGLYLKAQEFLDHQPLHALNINLWQISE